MIGTNRWWAFAGLALLAACTVEPREIRVEPEPFDGGPRADAGFRDAGASCLFAEYDCPAGQYCTSQDVCAVIPSRCAATQDCIGDAVCIRPLVDNSTSTPGRCATRPDACGLDRDCASGVCMGVGICGPIATRFTVEESRPSIQLSCDVSRDCGPRAVCRGGACGACQDSSECPRNLSCDDGACVESMSCLRDENCYEGHVCAPGAVCTRSVEGCTSDPSNDVSSGAESIADGHFEGLSICGVDTDWYELTIPNLQGAYVTIATPEATYATLSVGIQTPGEVGDRLRRIDLPGVVAFSIPRVDLREGEDSIRVLFSVATLDRSAPYSIDVRFDIEACGDELDLYGDDPSARLIGPPNVAFELVGCPGEVDRFVMSGLVDDVLEGHATWAGPSMDVDIAMFDGATRLTPTTTSTSKTVERVATTPLTRDGLVSVESTPKDAPSGGQSYTMTVSRDLGSRQAACASATAVTLSNNRAVVTGDFTGGANLGRPVCAPDPQCGGANCERYAPFERRDRLFRLEPVMTPAIVIATVRPLTGAAVHMSVALLSTCDDDASDVACNASAFARQPTTIEHRLETPDAVYFMVSSEGGDEDFAFELDIMLEPIVPPGNELCFDATVLASSDDRIVSTFGSVNDDQLIELSPACGPAAQGQGPDRFYRLSLVARERAAMELSGALGGFIWAGRSCVNMTSTCTTAASIPIDYSNPVAKIHFEPGADQTFYVAVDGLEREDAARYRLRTIREPQLQCLDDADCAAPLKCDDYACRPVPTSDACPGTSITLDQNGFARIIGSTGAATDRLSPSCIGSASPDVVYAVTIEPGFTDVVFRIVDANFDPALAVRPNQCDPTPSELCNDDARFPDELLPAVHIESPNAGVYYVIVDAFAGEGVFTLEVEGTR